MFPSSRTQDRTQTRECTWEYGMFVGCFFFYTCADQVALLTPPATTLIMDRNSTRSSTTSGAPHNNLIPSERALCAFWHSLVRLRYRWSWIWEYRARECNPGQNAIIPCTHIHTWGRFREPGENPHRHTDGNLSSGSNRKHWDHLEHHSKRIPIPITIQ